MYIVDQANFDNSKGNCYFKLQEYLNNKHDHSKPWELVNVVSVTPLYDKAEDIIEGKVSSINVLMVWRTHR